MGHIQYIHRSFHSTAYRFHEAHKPQSGQTAVYKQIHITSRMGIPFGERPEKDCLYDLILFKNALRIINV